MKNSRLSLALASLFFATACTSVPMADPADDSRGKQFEAPVAGQVALYFYRPNYPSATSFTVTVGQRTVGQLVGGTYLRADVEPGRHDVRCVGSENAAGLVVNAASGSIHFIKVTTRPGILCGLVEAQPSDGRLAIANSKRALDIR